MRFTGRILIFLTMASFVPSLASAKSLADAIKSVEAEAPKKKTIAETVKEMSAEPVGPDVIPYSDCGSEKHSTELTKLEKEFPDADFACRSLVKKNAGVCSPFLLGGKDRCRRFIEYRSVSPPTESEGAVASFDFYINQSVDTANCFRAVVPCYRNSDRSVDGAVTSELRGSLKQVIEACRTKVDDDGADQVTMQTKAYYKEALQRFEAIGVCLYDEAQKQEEQAQRLLENSRIFKTESLARSQKVHCYDPLNDNATESWGGTATARTCQFNSDPNETFATIPNTDPGMAEKSPGSVGYSYGSGLDKQNCSGTLLKGGRDVSTAGHCMDFSGESATVKMEVYDRNGKIHLVKATCAKGIDDIGKSKDFSLCTLDEPIAEAPDTLLLLRDDSAPAGCKEVNGYEFHCSKGDILKVGDSLSTVRGHASFEARGAKRLFVGEGYTRIDPETGQVFSSGMARRGMSGGGLEVEMNGRNVVVGPLSHMNDTLSPLGASAFIASPELLESSRRQLGIESIEAAQPLMRELALLEGKP